MKFTWSFGHEQPKPVPGWRHPHPNHEKNHNSCSLFSQSFQNGCHGRTSSFSTQTDVDGCWDLEKRPLPQHHVGRYYPPYPFHGSFKIPRSGIGICQIINSQVSIYSAGLFWLFHLQAGTYPLCNLIHSKQYYLIRHYSLTLVSNIYISKMKDTYKQFEPALLVESYPIIETIYKFLYRQSLTTPITLSWFQNL